MGTALSVKEATLVLLNAFNVLDDKIGFAKTSE